MKKITKFKVAVTGCKEFYDYALLKHFLDYFYKVYDKKILVTTGKEFGACELAVEYAERNCVELVVFEVDFREHRNKAKLVRDQEIIFFGDVVIEFWDGKTKTNTEKICNDYNKPLIVVNYNEEFVEKNALALKKFFELRTDFNNFK